MVDGATGHSADYFCDLRPPAVAMPRSSPDECVFRLLASFGRRDATTVPRQVPLWGISRPRDTELK